MLLGALALLAAGLVLRGALPGALLYPGTVLACGAIALMNVLLPSLIKRRQPGRAGLLIGIYLLCLAVGSVLGSLLAVPAYRDTAHAAWLGGPVRFCLWLWAVPAAVIAFAVWLPQWRYRTHARPGAGRPGGQAGRARVAVARHALAWQVTAFMGLQSLSYYAALSWLPTLLRDRGVSAAHAGDLLALMNFGNAVTGMLIPVLAHRMAGQRRAGRAHRHRHRGRHRRGAVRPARRRLGLDAAARPGPGRPRSAWRIFFTMARAPDPVTAASLSALAQGGGYLLATAGPARGRAAARGTGGWDVPVALLLVLCAAELAAGWLAARGPRLTPARRGSSCRREPGALKRRDALALGCRGALGRVCPADRAGQRVGVGAASGLPPGTRRRPRRCTCRCSATWSGARCGWRASG